MSNPRSVLFVCLGNICRSPLAEGLFKEFVKSQGEQASYSVDSAGTSGWHKGELPDPGSIRVAKKYGVDITDQRSRPVEVPADADFDLVVAMDRKNLAWLKEHLALPEDRLLLLRRFDEESLDVDVPDPYGHGPEGFEEVYQIINRSMPGLKVHLDGLAER